MLERWHIVSFLVLLFVIYQKYAACEQPTQEWVTTKSHLASASNKAASSSFSSFFTSIFDYCTSLLIRGSLLLLLILNARRIFDAVKIPRTVSLTHWSGAIFAHRGYRSEAQQNNKLTATVMKRHSRKSSRVTIESAIPPATTTTTTTSSHSRRGSRDESANQLAASTAILTAHTVGTTLRPIIAATPPGLPLANGHTRRQSNPPKPMSSSSLESLDKPDPANYNIPENSMLAFIYAHEHGVHGVEVDVALTKDGHIIVMHDNTLERTTDGVGEVADLTLEQIKSFKYRPVTDQEYIVKDERNKSIDYTRIPLLEEVIQFCKERNLKLMIETKEYANPTLLRHKLHALYQQYDMYTWSFVASFNPYHIFWYRREYPAIPTCLLYCRTCTQWYHEDASKEMLLPPYLNFLPVRMFVDWLLFYLSPTWLAEYLGVAMVGGHNILISPALITSLTLRGIVCDVWTVNSELEKQWLKSLGCIVTSDRLFTFDDISPFAEEIATSPSVVAPAPVERKRAPSIHAAHEFIANSYYISNSQHVSPININSPISGYDITPSPQPQQLMMSYPNVVVAGGQQHHHTNSSSNTSLNTLPDSTRQTSGVINPTNDPFIGFGSVSLARLRMMSDDTRTPGMSPTSYAIAQDRLTSDGTKYTPVICALSDEPEMNNENDSEKESGEREREESKQTSDSDMVMVEQPSSGENTSSGGSSTSPEAEDTKQLLSTNPPPIPSAHNESSSNI